MKNLPNLSFDAGIQSREEHWESLKKRQGKLELVVNEYVSDHDGLFLQQALYEVVTKKVDDLKRLKREVSVQIQLLNQLSERLK